MRGLSRGCAIVCLAARASAPLQATDILQRGLDSCVRLCDMCLCRTVPTPLLVRVVCCASPRVALRVAV
eukprot:15172450-Alexandrium_andersonii.AAC.1